MKRIQSKFGILASLVFYIKKGLQRANVMLDGIVYAETRVNVSDVLQRYVDLEIDDIEEFAAIYTYDYHDYHRMLDNKKSKLKMYGEVYAMMKALKDRGSLDKR